MRTRLLMAKNSSGTLRASGVVLLEMMDSRAGTAGRRVSAHGCRSASPHTLQDRHAGNLMLLQSHEVYTTSDDVVACKSTWRPK
jgi:hypothetical protein